MTFKQICDFIENKMRMSHIYQPLLIRTLVDSDGISTSRDIALEFLKYVESQIQYYESIIKKMPVRVLLSHNVITKEKNIVKLNADNLSFTQKQKIKFLCDKKLNEFLESGGLKLWDYRLMDNPVPDSLRYTVLKEAFQA
jgi:hypothetical protein